MSTIIMPTESEFEALRSNPELSKGKVDRKTKHGALRGFVVAQLGHFKTPGRGQFSLDSLNAIVRIGNAAPGGLRSRFTHPGLSSDGLGSFLGRADTFVLGETRDGIPAVRADLLFASAANKSPRGKLAEYVMNLAEEDPDAISSSLVVEEFKSVQLKDENGNAVEGEPAIWIPTKLRAIDIVDIGDAVDGLLSNDELSKLQDTGVRNVSKQLDMLLAGQEAETIKTRCYGFIDSYLANRVGEEGDDEDLSHKEEEADMAETQNQETDARLSSVEDKLSTVEESLNKKIDTLTDLIKSDQDERKALAAKNARVKAIQAKGALCGASAEQVTKWINDEDLSVEDVKDQIIEDKFEKAKNLSSGSSGDAPEDNDSPEALAKEQFKKRGKADGPKVIDSSLTEEDYALSAAVDAGEVDLLAVEPEKKE